VSIWFIIWLVLSGSLLYFLGWTLYILYRQKKAWKLFANQKKLRYRSKSILGSPEMSGTIDKYTVNIFIAEHMSPDARSSRKLTAVEIQLASKMPFDGGLASGGMVPIMQGFRLKEEYRPDHPKWDKNYIAASSSRGALEAYLTPPRIDALTSMMKIRNGWVIFVFRGDSMLLRFDTPDPLDSIEKLSKILKKMMDTSMILELNKGEEGILKAEAAKRSAKEVNIAVDDRDFSEAKDIQLEE
jgi:hypothetical protein